jgi:hypothetical protein
MDFVTRRKYKNKTCSFVNKINLHSTIREEEVHWPEFGVFNFHVLANYDFSLLYVPICLFLNTFHFCRILRTTEDPKVTSILLLICI